MMNSADARIYAAQHDRVRHGDNKFVRAEGGVLCRRMVLAQNERLLVETTSGQSCPMITENQSSRERYLRSLSSVNLPGRQQDWL
jgi:hypothetical protein